MIKKHLFKTLSVDAEPIHGGDGQYQLGKWTPSLEPIPCRQGYHVCTAADLLDWLGPRIFLVEVRGKIIESHYKLTCESIRTIRELPFDGQQFFSWCLARARPLLPHDWQDASTEELIMLGNIENRQQILAYSLALQANEHSIEAAVQVGPKRAAQAVAWRAHQSRIDAAWAETDGEAPPEYWAEVEREAAAAKTLAHDNERSAQLSELMMRLGFSSTPAHAGEAQPLSCTSAEGSAT